MSQRPFVRPFVSNDADTPLGQRRLRLLGDNDANIFSLY